MAEYAKWWLSMTKIQRLLDFMWCRVLSSIAIWLNNSYFEASLCQNKVKQSVTSKSLSGEEVHPAKLALLNSVQSRSIFTKFFQNIPQSLPHRLFRCLIQPNPASKTPPRCQYCKKKIEKCLKKFWCKHWPPFLLKTISAGPEKTTPLNQSDSSLLGCVEQPSPIYVALQRP